MYLHLSNNAPPKGRSRPFPCQLQSFLVFVFGGGPELCDTNPMKKNAFGPWLGTSQHKAPRMEKPLAKRRPGGEQKSCKPIVPVPNPTNTSCLPSRTNFQSGRSGACFVISLESSHGGTLPNTHTRARARWHMHRCTRTHMRGCACTYAHAYLHAHAQTHLQRCERPLLISMT